LKRALGILLILLAAFASWTFGQKTLERSRLSRRTIVLRDSASMLRRDAEMCQASVSYEESVFRDFAIDVDSMLVSVEAYEGAGPRGRGVDEAEYDEYLEAFDEYNAAVGDWEERAQRLRKRADLCRSLFVQHNQLVDTLRVLAERLTGS
jgi:hypothetical protein